MQPFSAQVREGFIVDEDEEEEEERDRRRRREKKRRRAQREEEEEALDEEDLDLIGEANPEFERRVASQVCTSLLEIFKEVAG
jgi:transcription elongation factor SPT6